MQIGQRKKILASIKSLAFLLTKVEYEAKDLMRCSSEAEYQGVVNYFKESIKKLKQEAAKLPIGHEYKGIFYLKKPYRPGEFKKVNGTLFLREDLVRWFYQGERENDCGYVQEAFRTEGVEQPLERADGKPVYKAITEQQAETA